MKAIQKLLQGGLSIALVFNFILLMRFTWFIVLALVLFSSCENDMATVKKLASKQEVSVESAFDIETFYSDAGKTKAKLTSPQLLVYQGKEPYKELPKGLTVNFYDNNQQEDGKLTALYGILYDNMQKVIVKNKVVVVNIKGETLHTEELTWDISRHRIYTNKAVIIQTGNEKIFGEGMDADEDFTNYKIKKIRGIVNVKDNDIN
jgi:LPS export ABC transporter protein LptC